MSKTQIIHARLKPDGSPDSNGRVILMRKGTNPDFKG